jgi:hypothetical protein
MMFTIMNANGSFTKVVSHFTVELLIIVTDCFLLFFLCLCFSPLLRFQSFYHLCLILSGVFDQLDDISS